MRGETKEKKKLKEREQLKKRYQTQAILSASTRQNDLLDPSIDPSISLCFAKPYMRTHLVVEDSYRNLFRAKSGDLLLLLQNH